MSDIKLFRISDSGITALSGTTDTVEKSVQNLFEAQMEALLGVRFLASEFVTTNGGRIDSLGIDENGCPVIIEYKRAMNENVINQGLFYMDWLLDHRKDFQWLTMERLGQAVAAQVQWSSPRLICIAGDFSRYDNFAVKQMPHNIELVRYRRFGGDLMLLEVVASSSGKMTPISEKDVSAASQATGNGYKQKTVTEVMANLSADMIDRYEALRAFIMALGDDIQENTLQLYVAFKRLKNIACVEFRARDAKIIVFLRVDPKTVILEDGFSRDVSEIGHYGTGDLELSLMKASDLEKAMPLIKRSYENA
ncbi:MAG: DUF5655 domain-containing protein [Asticcacaulis sp.]